MPRLPCCTTLLAACLLAAPAQADPARGPEIQTDDVTRFYALYDATQGRPTVEQIERDYLARRTQGLGEFARLRRVTAQSIADRLQSDPGIYARAKECLATLPAVETRLAAAFGRLATLYPQARLPPVAIVVGRGKPVGMTHPGGVTIGLEALCAADFMNPDVEDRFVHVIAHEYAHIQQTSPTDFEQGDPNATVLRVSLAEGVAELIAEVISGNVGNARHAQWTRGKEAEIESAFVRDMDSTDLSAWLFDYRAGSDEPYDLGYWVGYRIAKAYYLQATDRKAALREMIELDDPKAFLARSGWTPGMQLPATVHGAALAAQPAGTAPPQALDEAAAGRFARLALTCLHQQYPNKIAHVMQGDADVLPPRALTPAFFGCYDWHSAVHGHWLLVRLLRRFPDAPFAQDARAALATSLTPQNIATEVQYLTHAKRASFERPYGLAWLLQLSAELRGWDDPQARQWATTLAPLESAAASRLKDWLPKLHYPIRVGEHDQTAFAFGLVWDWAQVAGDAQMTALLQDAAARFYRNDRACPLGYEPSGQDFLSPCLAEADFMRRVLAPDDFSKWLKAFLPQVPGRGDAQWLQPGVVTDRTDPKLAHIDGLNLSRAWMLEGIAHGLDPKDRRVRALRAAAANHGATALPAVTGEHYEGGHWLGTFAVYLTSQAGLR